MSKPDLIYQGGPGPVSIGFAAINALKAGGLAGDNQGSDPARPAAHSDGIVRNIVGQKIVGQFWISPGWLDVSGVTKHHEVEFLGSAQTGM
jgi:hypothetical protein